MVQIKFSIEPLKEPKGFIKLPLINLFTKAEEFLICLPIVLYSNASILSQLFSIISFALLVDCRLYPFSSSDLFPADVGSEYETSAQFYVFVGVITFIVSFCTLVVYLLLVDSLNNIYWLCEFGYQCLWCFFWLVAASNWAARANDSVLETVKFCPTESTASVVFGYICWLLTAANAYYVFKETSLHKEPHKEAAARNEKELEGVSGSNSNAVSV
eukprot:Nk52_evm15s151 gene=Nk52_evmTU15s151